MFNAVKISPYKIFLLTRMFALALRPLFLAVLLYLDFKEFSTFYALVITVIQGSLFLLNSESHREFYKYNFGVGASLYERAKYLNFYSGAFFNHLKLALLPIAFLCFFMMEGGIISFFIIFSCFVEKIYDELQRYQIYDKNYILWSKIAILKLVFPLMFVFPFVFLDEVLAAYIYLFLHAFFIIVSAFLCGVIKQRYIHFRMSLKKYCKILFENRFKLVFYSLLVSNSLYFDRLYVGKFYVDVIDSYLLICNVSVMFVIAYDYFYLTKVKPVLVKGEYEPFTYIFNWYNGGFLLVSLFLSVFCYIVMIFFNYSINPFSPLFVLLLSVSYCIYNFFSPLIQYAYWHMNISVLACLEIVVLCGYLSALHTFTSESVVNVSLIFLLYILFRGIGYLIYTLYRRKI